MVVACGVDTTLSRCGAGLNVWDTDAKYDFTRGVYDRMDGLLREGFSHGKEGPVRLIELTSHSVQKLINSVIC